MDGYCNRHLKLVAMSVKELQWKCINVWYYLLVYRVEGLRRYRVPLKEKGMPASKKRKMDAKTIQWQKIDITASSPPNEQTSAGILHRSPTRELT